MASISIISLNIGLTSYASDAAASNVGICPISFWKGSENIKLVQTSPKDARDSVNHYVNYRGHELVLRNSRC